MANWSLSTVNGRADRYKFDDTITLNSVNTAGTSANISVTVRVQACWGGYDMYWHCYNRIQLKNGSTTLADSTIYTSTMGNGNGNDSAYHYYCKTHGSNGSTNDVVPHDNGVFFT